MDAKQLALMALTAEAQRRWYRRGFHSGKRACQPAITIVGYAGLPQPGNKWELESCACVVVATQEQKTGKFPVAGVIDPMTGTAKRTVLPFHKKGRFAPKGAVGLAVVRALLWGMAPQVVREQTASTVEFAEAGSVAITPPKAKMALESPAWKLLEELPAMPIAGLAADDPLIAEVCKKPTRRTHGYKIVPIE